MPLPLFEFEEVNYYDLEYWNGVYYLQYIHKDFLLHQIQRTHLEIDKDSWIGIHMDMYLYYY